MGIRIRMLWLSIRILQWIKLIVEFGDQFMKVGGTKNFIKLIFRITILLLKTKRTTGLLGPLPSYQ